MKKIKLLFAVVSSVLILLLTVTFSEPIKAQQPLSLKIIAAKILQTMPNKNYKVTINQSITAPDNTKTKQAIGSGLFRKNIQFKATYAPNKGLKAQKVINTQLPHNKNIAQGSPNQPRLVKQGDIRLIVDISTVLKKINNWQDVKISNVIFNSQKYFKVSAKMDQFSFIFWINAKYFYVSKTTLFIKDVKYAQINFKYKYLNNKYWMPNSLTYVQYPERSQIVQNFSSYIFK